MFYSKWIHDDYFVSFYADFINPIITLYEHYNAKNHYATIHKQNCNLLLQMND